MRKENWQNDLSSYLDSVRHTPFDFPTHNCLMFVFGAIEAITGQDLGEPYRGKYKDERSAARLLRKTDNVKTSEELLEKHFGEPKPLAFARLGDIVFVDPLNAELELPSDIDLFGPVPGICYGSVSFFVGENGLLQFETLRLDKTLWVS